MAFSMFFLKKFSFLDLKLFQKAIVFLFVFFLFPAFAVKVHFPDEELAEESVLPLVTPPRMVLNRNVPLKFRVELGAGLAVGLDEPFYLPYYPTGLITFHLTEVHALSLTGAYFFPKRSASGEKLSQGKGLKSGKKFDPLKAPYLQMSAFINYQYSPYYGKISLAKNWVMNLSIYGFIGPGLLVTNQNNQLFAGSFGFGQKLYFNKWLGFKMDLGFYGYYGPAVAKLDLGESVSSVSYNQIKSEDKRLIFNVMASMGLVLLL